MGGWQASLMNRQYSSSCYDRPDGMVWIWRNVRWYLQSLLCLVIRCEASWEGRGWQIGAIHAGSKVLSLM